MAVVLLYKTGCFFSSYRLVFSPVALVPSSDLVLDYTVKPGKVDITKAENNEFEWEVPKTWNRPCTFFPLQYEVKVVSHRKDCDETSHDHEGNHSHVSMWSVTTNKVLRENGLSVQVPHN